MPTTVPASTQEKAKTNSSSRLYFLIFTSKEGEKRLTKLSFSKRKEGEREESQGKRFSLLACVRVFECNLERERERELMKTTMLVNAIQ